MNISPRSARAESAFVYVCVAVAAAAPVASVLRRLSAAKTILFVVMNTVKQTRVNCCELVAVNEDVELSGRCMAFMFTYARCGVEPVYVRSVLYEEDNRLLGSFGSLSSPLPRATYKTEVHPPVLLQW
ncbi:unnamed protein product [Sphagnum balticum]|jgi:hypothetical protein